MKRILALIVVLGVAASWLSGCGAKQKEPAPAGAPLDVASAHGGAVPGNPPPAPSGQSPPGAPGGMPMVVPPPPTGGSPTSAAGLAWTLPADWAIDAPRSMRVATYAIRAVAGDAEGAECAVYYFGEKQGGGVDANLERWIGEFQPLADSKRTTRAVDGVRVSLVDASGTYMAHGGSMTQPRAGNPGWRLLGAIAEGPQGAVFFKLAGPAKTVAAARRGFDDMVGSLRKE